MNRIIFHIDFDSFFASCEQHFNPNLRNKPIGVTAANGRTCIIAASKEAKKYGIKTGMRTWEASALCPSIQYVKGDFDRYLDITKKFVEITGSYSPFVEVFSLDEVFIDMTSTFHLFEKCTPRGCTYEETLLGLAKKFKQQVATEISPITTVSIGVSYNKLLAKLASGLNKPDGLMVIDRNNLESVYKNTQLTDICGIGERLKKRLNILGIYNLLALRAYPIRLLKKEFGNVCADQLMCYAWALDDSEVNSVYEDTDAKSVGRNFCLAQNEEDQGKILQILSELSEEVARRLRAINKKARTINLYLSGEKSMGGRKTISTYVNMGKDIYEVIKLFYREWGWKYMVRQIHVSVSNLIDEKYVTQGLFDDPREEVLNQVIDNLNKKFGSHTIRHGYVLYAPKLETKPNGFLGDKAFYLPYLRTAS